MNATAAPAAGFQLAMSLFQQGRDREAEQQCREALDLQPRHAGALHLLGLLALRAGRFASAIELIGQSVVIDPAQPLAQSNLGAALLSLKRPGDALECFEHSLRCAPDSVMTWYNHGTALLQLRRPEEALPSFERALQLQPDYAEALNNCGAALNLLNRHAQALDCYDRALLLKPDVAETLNNRGNVLQALRRHADALQCYERALRLRADFPEALAARAKALHQLGRLEEALTSLEALLQMTPRNADALFERGNVLLELSRAAEAIDSYEAALRLRGDFVEALAGRGNAQLSHKQYANALASYDQVLQLRPELAEVWNNRGNALRHLRQMDDAVTSFERSIQLGEARVAALANLGWASLETRKYEAAADCFAKVLAISPEHDYVLGAMCFARLNCCDWTGYRENADAIVAAVAADKRAIAPFPLLAVSDSADLNLRCARTCAAHRYPAAATPAWRGRRYDHERIRVAYVSPDLRDHVVSHLLAPLIERIDRSRFETIAISLGPAQSSPFGGRIERAFDRFLDVSSMTDAEAAELMCRMEVDIAVDLAGYTGDLRTGIFAQRAAPVQLSYLGYPGSMGAHYIDYIVADAVVVPEAYRDHYSEKIVWLPQCYQVNHSERRPPADALTRAACGLPEHGLVLCCFNASFKLTPAVFDIWMRVMQQVNDSVLWLAGHRPSVARNLRAAAAARGIAPERLVFAQHRPNLDDHLARYALADLFLDTYPFNAHATASDALWHGLPVVTCSGETFASRVAGSVLQAMGLPQLVTRNLEAYELQVLELATHRAQLAEIRAMLLRRRSDCALFDTDRFRLTLESAYQTMWERSQRGDPPASFAVTPIE